MDELIYPLTFEPTLKDYMWGGRRLESKLGRSLPPGIVAESWEISGHPAGPTVVEQGPLAGQSLPQLVERLGQKLIGHRSQAMLDRGRFPLLIKLLDANKPLSVQVHPDDEYAQAHEKGELGKTEMWYILEAKPEAYLIYGLEPDVTPAAFRRALENGELEPLLHKLPVQAGDAIFIPTGTLHAIMDGILLTEIQQTSDATYRVYDWNRLGPDGQPRPLHVDKALDVINFDMVRPEPVSPQLIEAANGLRRELLVSCPYFNVEKVSCAEGSAFRGECDGSTFEIWGILSGQSRLNWAGDPLSIEAVRYMLLPAVLGVFEIEAVTPAVFLRIYVGETDE